MIVSDYPTGGTNTYDCYGDESPTSTDRDAGRNRRLGMTVYYYHPTEKEMEWSAPDQIEHTWDDDNSDFFAPVEHIAPVPLVSCPRQPHNIRAPPNSMM